jgi:hypothetical protein
VEVKPASDTDDPSLMTCRATVRSSKGTLIFEQEDWGIEIDPITGRDVNGDGIPDAVLVSFSGGAHCCWSYYIISLGKRPGLIAKFENQASASFQDLRRDGKVQIVVRDGTFDFDFGLSHAFSPFPLLIVQLHGSTFQDVSAGFRALYEKEIQRERSQLNPESLQEFARSHSSEGLDSADHEAIECSILLMALDYLYAQRTRDARNVLDEFWPVESREQTWQEMIRGYCSGLRSQLRVNVKPPCESR